MGIDHRLAYRARNRPSPMRPYISISVSICAVAGAAIFFATAKVNFFVRCDMESMNIRWKEMGLLTATISRKL